MADELTAQSNKDAIFSRVNFLLEGGMNVKEACLQVERENGQKWATTKQQFVRRSGSTGKHHGRCKLTKSQEGVILSMAIVYSTMHEALSLDGLQEQVQIIYSIEVGQKWASCFWKRHKDELKMPKTKLLSS